jgi:hypothetical protein
MRAKVQSGLLVAFWPDFAGHHRFTLSRRSGFGGALDGSGHHGGNRTFDRYANQVTPFGPRAVVVFHIFEAKQIGQYEPGVAAPLADAAVGDRSAAARQAVFAAI